MLTVSLHHHKQVRDFYKNLKENLEQSKKRELDQEAEEEQFGL